MKTISKMVAVALIVALAAIGCKKSASEPEGGTSGSGKITPQVKMAEYTYTIGTELTASNRNSFQGKKLATKDMLYMIGNYGTANSMLMLGFKPDTSIAFTKKLVFPRPSSFVDNIVSDGSGGFIIAGRYDRGYPFVARLNASGAVLWSKTITDTKNSIYSSGTDMFVIPGLSEVNNGKFAIFFTADIILFDTDGKVMWRAGTNRTSRGVVTSDGVIAFGQKSGDTRFTIKKLDMSGKLLWSKAAEKAPNSAMAFGNPIVLADQSILLSYVHKSTINAASNYGLFNITPDGNIKSNKLYLAAPIQPDRDNRPSELHRKSDGKIWFHFPGRKYLSGGQSDPLEVGFNLNEDGTVDGSGFFQGENSSFGFENNKVISFNDTRVTVGSLTASCASNGNKVNIQDAFLDFGVMKTFIEPLTAETYTVADYPFEVSDAGTAVITVLKRCL